MFFVGIFNDNAPDFSQVDMKEATVRSILNSSYKAFFFEAVDGGRH